MQITQRPVYSGVDISKIFEVIPDKGEVKFDRYQVYLQVIRMDPEFLELLVDQYKFFKILFKDKS